MSNRPETIPEPYWNSMPEWIQAEVVRLEERYGLILPTGSRYICPDCVTCDADYDVYFVSPQNTMPGGELLGARYSTVSGGRYNADDPGISLYRGEIDAVGHPTVLNVGIFFDPRYAQATKEATEFCLDLHVTDKEKRKRIFRRFMDAATGGRAIGYDMADPDMPGKMAPLKFVPSMPATWTITLPPIDKRYQSEYMRMMEEAAWGGPIKNPAYISTTGTTNDR